MEPAFTSCRATRPAVLSAGPDLTCPPADATPDAPMQGGQAPAAAAIAVATLAADPRDAADTGPVADASAVQGAGPHADAAPAEGDTGPAAVPADPAAAPAGALAGAGVASFQLPERLDTRAAAPLAAALIARRGTALTLDAASVGFVGALCAQVLLAARRSWQDDGAALHIVRPAAGFTEGMRALGLDGLIPTEEATG